MEILFLQQAFRRITMKKFCALILALILTVTLCACGRRKDDTPTEKLPPVTTEPATMPPATTEPATTAPTVVPDIPELEPNSPDPTVDSNSTDDGIDMPTDTARRRSRVK